MQCGVCDCPRWFATADALFLTRSSAAPHTILFDTAGVNPVFDASDADFDFEVGSRLRVMRQARPGAALSFEYFGMDQWNSRTNFGSRQVLFAGDMNGTYDSPLLDALNLDYTSRLHGAEVDLWGGMNSRISYFGGFRWLSLDETFSVIGKFDPMFGAVPLYADYTTQNDLWGFQLGGNATLWDAGGPLRFDSYAKAGIYYNHAEFDFGAQVPGIVTLAADDTQDQTAFIGEVGVNLTLQLTRYLALRGGYQVMWLSGVAMAPDQIARLDTDTSSVDMDATGIVFLHGANVGLELRW
jgi:hypothetical protein